MSRCALMLRGINVGGAHRVAMADLRAVLTAHGHRGVATHGQSGNVVLDADVPSGSDPALTELEGDVGRLLGERLGFSVPVAARTAGALDAVLARDPLDGAADDDRRYVVTFLADAPGSAAFDRLWELRAEDERLVCLGRELYSHHPRGQGRSRLAAALTAPALGASATVRNWATVTRLAAMARG